MCRPGCWDKGRIGDQDPSQMRLRCLPSPHLPSIEKKAAVQLLEAPPTFYSVHCALGGFAESEACVPGTGTGAFPKDGSMGGLHREEALLLRVAWVLSCGHICSLSEGSTSQQTSQAESCPQGPGLACQN